MTRASLFLLMVVLLALIVLAGCAAKKAPIATGERTSGFVPAPGLFAERDVQYIGSTPHCIFRLTLVEAPDGLASSLEVPMQWCEGVR